jgi:hypothetical protein
MTRNHTHKNKVSLSIRTRRNTIKHNYKKNIQQYRGSYSTESLFNTDIRLTPITCPKIIRQIQERTKHIRLPEHINEDEWVQRMGHTSH